VDVLILLAPLPALAVGAVIASEQSISVVSFAPNLLALFLGIALVPSLWPVRPSARKPWTRWLPFAGAILVGITLLSPGLDGVHRWITLGPVRLNVSSVVCPWLLAGVHVQARRSAGLALAMLAALVLLHALQPDAAQATALALAGIILILRDLSAAPRMRAVSVVLVLSLTGLAWSRPDPLPALTHVERVLALALSQGAGFAFAAMASLALLMAPMLIAVARGGASSPLALAFAVYFLGTVVGTWCGNYPVPVMGAGAGPVLGWYAMLAYLRGADVVPAGQPSAVGLPSVRDHGLQIGAAFEPRSIVAVSHSPETQWSRSHAKFDDVTTRAREGVLDSDHMPDARTPHPHA
jgi:hypothetical protein